jgi:hypothetical protein
VLNEGGQRRRIVRRADAAQREVRRVPALLAAITAEFQERLLERVVQLSQFVRPFGDMDDQRARPSRRRECADAGQRHRKCRHVAANGFDGAADVEDLDFADFTEEKERDVPVVGGGPLYAGGRLDEPFLQAGHAVPREPVDADGDERAMAAGHVIDLSEPRP